MFLPPAHTRLNRVGYADSVEDRAVTELLIGVASMLLGIAVVVAPWALHHVVSAVQMAAVGASAAVTVVFGVVLIHEAIEHRHGHRPRSG